MARREPFWVKLFLRELERTGNVRVAAERAGVDYTSAYQRRKRHAEFADAWQGALAAHSFRVEDEREEEAALTLPQPAAAPSLSPDGRGAAPPPCSTWSPSPSKLGEETVVRPDGKVIKGSAARWGKRAEERFLTELTTSANIRLAATAAGFSTAAVYKRRLKDRRFRAAWDAALETGGARVQAYLVEAATRTFDPDELPIGDERELPKVSVSEAINIAKLPTREPGGATGFGKGGWGLEGRTYDETGFDTTPITREEWEEASQNIVKRLDRLRDKLAEEERVTGRCQSCGQPLPVDGA